MALLETTSGPEAWHVDLSAALQQRERRHSFATSEAEHDGIRRWLVDMVSPDQVDAEPVAPPGLDSAAPKQAAKYVVDGHGTDTVSDDSTSFGRGVKLTLDTMPEACASTSAAPQALEVPQREVRGCARRSRSLARAASRQCSTSSAGGGTSMSSTS